MSTERYSRMCRKRLVERQAEHVLDHDLVREADAEREASAARDLHRERLLRHRQRMARVGRHDAGRELDARHLAADDREHAHRVEAEDLGEREAREAVCLGRPRRGDDVVDRATSGVTAEDADPHGCSFVVRRRGYRRDAKRPGVGRAGPGTLQRIACA